MSILSKGVSLHDKTIRARVTLSSIERDDILILIKEVRASCKVLSEDLYRSRYPLFIPSSHGLPQVSQILAEMSSSALENRLRIHTAIC